MNKKNFQITTQPPPGTRDFLPADAGLFTRTADILLREYAGWGYRRVITPSIEFLDVFSNLKVNGLFKVVDINSGELISFRSDFTPQIARLSSAIMHSRTLPFKFSYFGPVLRNLDPGSGKPREIWQVGVELIGPYAPESDAELIVMGIESLNGLNFRDFNIDVGNVEFFRGIVENIKENDRKKIEECVARKDSSGLKLILEDMSVDDKKKETIKDLPLLFGEKSIIKKAWKMADNDRSKRALEDLERVLNYVKLYKKEKYITIDLGEIRGLNYYTGTIFECFIPHIGHEIFGGGRYNNLTGMFGPSCGGAGFAVDLETVTRHMGEYRYPSEDYLIANVTGNHSFSVEINIFLRRKGFKVEVSFMDYSYLDFIEYMKQNDIKNIVYIFNDKKSSKGSPLISFKKISEEKENIFRSIPEFKEFIVHMGS